MQAVPHIIHQTWKSEAVPEHLRAFQQTWPALHPEWEYRFWTDEDLRAFISRAYPWFLATFNGYDEPIKRVDASRYFMLHYYGGVYADLDCECVQPLGPLLDGAEIVLGLDPPQHTQEPAYVARGLTFVIGNAIMASAARHPFWEHVFQMLLNSSQIRDVLNATGPFMLTRAFETFPDREQITVVGPDAFNPYTMWEVRDDTLRPEQLRARAPASTYAIHYWRGTWRREQVFKLVRERLRAQRRDR